MSEHDQNSVPQDDPSMGGGGVTFLAVNAPTKRFELRKKGGIIAATYKQVRGRIVRLWKEWDDGNKEKKIEAGWRMELELKDALLIASDDSRHERGKVVIRVRPAVTLFTLGSKIHDLEPETYLAIELYGGNRDDKVAFAAVSKAVAGQWQNVRGTELDASGDRVEEVISLIEKNPCFGPPPKRNQDGEWAEFEAAALKAGWPALGVARDCYLEIAGGLSDAVYSGLDAVPGSVWEQMTKLTQDAEGRMPKKLVTWLANNKPAAATSAPPADEYDPFADD